MPQKSKTRKAHKTIAHIVIQRKEGKMPLIKHTHKKHRNIHKENEKRRRKERKKIAHFRRYYKPNPNSPDYDPLKPHYTHVANISGDEEDPLARNRPHTPDGPPPPFSKEDSMDDLIKALGATKITKKNPTKKGGKSKYTRKQIAKRKRITKKHNRKHIRNMRK